MKKSIHLTAESVAYMAARAGEINFSAAVNAAFEQLAHLARTEMPTLDDEELAELCNVYAGSDLTRIALPINLAADLMTHYGATITSQLPDNCQNLVEHLVTMTQAQQFSLLDKVRVFWRSAEGESVNT